MSTKNGNMPATARIQDHAAFRAGSHGFQADIERLAGDELIGRILQTVMLATGARFTAVSRVTADRWVACRTVDEVNFGLSAGDEIEIESTFCQTVRDTNEIVLFGDVESDTVYRGHPIAAKFGIVSYASFPIHRADGSFFGTLCAIDTVPRDIENRRVIEMLEMFADIIGRSLDKEAQIAAQEDLLAHQSRLARAQEEFVAILGHDLRNPVAAFEAGLRQLDREQPPARVPEIVAMIRPSLYRMKELIENLLLHAMDRLGSGITVTPVENAPLSAALTGVVDEIRAAEPGRRIELDLNLDRALRCDPQRVAQAVSNLVSNAVSHGAKGEPIRVRGWHEGSDVVLSVANHGAPIPSGLRENLFDPFRRGADAQSDGLGLGLNIAASIARAHGGQIDVDCADGVTTFRIVLPQDAG